MYENQSDQKGDRPDRVEPKGVDDRRDCAGERRERYGDERISGGDASVGDDQSFDGTRQGEHGVTDIESRVVMVVESKASG